MVIKNWSETEEIEQNFGVGWVENKWLQHLIADTSPHAWLYAYVSALEAPVQLAGQVCHRGELMVMCLGPRVYRGEDNGTHNFALED